MNDRLDVFRTIGFPLEGFTSTDSNDCMEPPDHLFVGRQVIIDKLVDLLESSRPRGSYLIAGYRGAGKTTIIKKALKKYSGGKRKALEVRINLGDTSELTPLSIYYSTINLLREELIDKCRKEWGSRFEPLVSTKAFGITIFLFLAALFPTAWFTWFGPDRDIPGYGDILWYFYLAILILILLKGAVGMISQAGDPELATLKEALKDIDGLIERISSEITEGRTAELSNRGFGFGLSRNKKQFPIKAREAEEVLFKIFKRIQSTSRFKIVIVLDEIDKLSDSEELSEIQDHDKSDAHEGGKISKINTLLASLKNFITTAEATFFFISGRETLDRYYSEKGSSNSLYESLFDRVFEIPSFLTDEGSLPRGNRLSALTEEYVFRRMRREASPDGKAESEPYYSLTTYSRLAKTYPILDEEPGLADQHIRQGINMLRNFIHYLTFHSWGNPKRLSSIFESFIVLRDEVNKAIEKDSILIIGEEGAIDKKKGGAVAKHWLVFNSNHQRRFSFASELTNLFSHQLGREVSKMSDKLTVSALSSLHYILKLHHYGFTRESLSRMSQAINVYRSTELNAIIDDLLTHVFKSYIRRIRNGLYRYRFNSSFEQELRYISHSSELESATYNFSLDSMRNVKQVFEDICASSKDIDVIAKSHITLGEIFAIEQSYTAASVHYGTASRLLIDLLSKSPFSVNLEILMQCIEAMTKHGDLEERRQNYNLAASIYFEANRIIQNLNDHELSNKVLVGDSKVDLLKQPFWALHFLSLKRSPRQFKLGPPANGAIKAPTSALIHSFKNSPLLSKPPKYLYSDKDQRFYYRAANLSFFLGEAERAYHHYLKVLRLLKQNYGMSEFPDENVAYLGGKARVGLAESALIFQARELYKDHRTTTRSKGEREFATKLLRDISEFSHAHHYIGNPLKIAAIGFEDNKLYISAVTAHIKAISYYSAILDVFDSNIFRSDETDSSDGIESNAANSLKVKSLADKVFKEILERGRDAIRCLNKARQLESSQSNKTFVMHDLETTCDKHEMTITKLFDMLTGTDINETYPVAEPIFWQNSLWAHKLAAALCWAYYVKSKIETKPDYYTKKIWNILPENLPSVLGESGFSIRPAILLRWIWARNLNRKYINRTLMNTSKGNCNTNEALDELYKNPNGVKLTDCGQEVVKYIFLLFNERGTIDQKEIPPTLKNAYLISRFLYIAQESSRIMSRKNLDLIFPRLPQIYFAQWKLLLNLMLAALVGYRENNSYSSMNLSSIRDFSLLLQRVFTIIDKKLAPGERIAASHFDYEFIHLRLSESLESSISMVDKTSRTHMSIFQHKFYCHDDHNDPDFQTDYTLAYMFAPRARYLHREVIDTHKDLLELPLLNRTGRHYRRIPHREAALFCNDPVIRHKLRHLRDKQKVELSGQDLDLI